MLLSMNEEVSSISSQIVEQIEVIPEVVSSEVSKLIDSDKQEIRRPKVFLSRKDSIK